MHNRRVNKGDNTTIWVNSREKHSTEVLIVEKGEIYSFYMDSEHGKWWDFFVRTDANGWGKDYFVGLRRVRQAAIFQLCACVDKDDSHSIVIGNSNEVSFDRNGKVSFFANDLPCMYWNDYGKILLKITRIG